MSDLLEQARRLADEWVTYKPTPSPYATAALINDLVARVEAAERLLDKARAGLADGLWDYGPGQDEHDACQALIDEIDEARKQG